MSTKIPEPWFSFLNEIDGSLTDETHFRCIGGFVVTIVYGFEREPSTSDIDILTLVKGTSAAIEKGQIGSELYKRYGLYVDPVGIATLPENYEDRLSEVFAGTFKHLRLFALDPYDVALAKIERNTDIDREDVKYLARVVPFDLDVLKARYYDELRVYLGKPEREDLTLKLWIDMIEEGRDQHRIVGTRTFEPAK